MKLTLKLLHDNYMDLKRKFDVLYPKLILCKVEECSDTKVAVITIDYYQPRKRLQNKQTPCVYTEDGMRFRDRIVVSEDGTIYQCFKKTASHSVVESWIKEISSQYLCHTTDHGSRLVTWQ